MSQQSFDVQVRGASMMLLGIRCFTGFNEQHARDVLYRMAEEQQPTAQSILLKEFFASLEIHIPSGAGNEPIKVDIERGNQLLIDGFMMMMGVTREIAIAALGYILLKARTAEGQG